MEKVEPGGHVPKSIQGWEQRRIWSNNESVFVQSVKSKHKDVNMLSVEPPVQCTGYKNEGRVDHTYLRKINLQKPF